MQVVLVRFFFFRCKSEVYHGQPIQAVDPLHLEGLRARVLAERCVG